MTVSVVKSRVLHPRVLSQAIALLWAIVMIREFSAGNALTPPPRQEGRDRCLWAEMQVIDSRTHRGVPLVELETVNGLKFVTDNAGRIALHEPGLMGREIFFHVRSHGYEIKKDGFGIAGVRLVPVAGEVRQIKVDRKNIAERLCRLTGEGRFRDSLLLGHQIPLATPLNPGEVAGQDSVQAVVYRKQVYWFWGDTSHMRYPLGLFRMAGATSALPDVSNSKTDPAALGGIRYRYFVDAKTGYARGMMPLPERPKGVVWVSAVFVLPVGDGIEKLVGHYSRRKGLNEELEQGIALFNDTREIFEPVRQLPREETWRKPSGHPFVVEEMGRRWLIFGSPTPNVRVPATWNAILDPAQYEAFTCARSAGDGKPAEPLLDAERRPIWRWQKQLPPVDSATEARWVAEGKLRPDDCRFHPADATGQMRRVVLHSGSVRWNAHRQRWILLAGQIGGQPSFLGEVWYAESAQFTGPFRKGVRVVTHDRQSFYNVCQHPFLDREGGRRIFFEGTYTHTFSGNPVKTPRYDYNQILYRLDLDTEELAAARESDGR